MDRDTINAQPVSPAPASGWTPARMLKRLPHIFGLALCVGAAMPTTMAACSNSTSQSGQGIPGVNSILFIKRVNTYVSNGQVTIDVAGGNGQVIDYQRYEPGGSLNLLAPATPDGVLTNLTSQFTTADFNGADVYFDGTQAVFSMKTSPSDNYHIYTVSLTPDSTGKFEIHQKTAGDYDDINPIYVAGGRIAFATNQMYTMMGTRADEYEHGRVVSQLATVSIEGGDADRRLFAQNLSHSVAPFSRADGTVGYSRWEHLMDVNDVKIFSVNPDGTRMAAVAGQHNKPVNSLINLKEISPNIMIGIGTARDRTIHSGTLIQIDARNQADAFCLNPANVPFTGHQCTDEQNAQFTILTPEVPSDSSPSPAGRYREPTALPDGRILTSWADGPVNDLAELSATPPDYGIYIYDPVSKTNQLVYNDRTMWDLNALPVITRTEPPVISDTQHTVDSTEPVKIGSVNLATTSLDETISGAQFTTGLPLGDALKQAVAVRVVEGFSSEAAKGVTMFGLTMAEGAAILGTAPVYQDGSWLANVPAYIMMHLQPIDKFGLAIRTQGLWMQGVPGEDRRCVGCHASRTASGQNAATEGQTNAEQAGPQIFTQSIAQRFEVPWADGYVKGSGVVQPLLTQKCAGCHNSGTTSYYQITYTDPVTKQVTTYNIPTLDLSDTPVTVVYDKKVATYPASYVSLYYPAALSMGMMNAKITGTVPPKWMIPEDARDSVLFSKLNIKAKDGTTAWPTSSNPFHPEDKGVTLTADERQILIDSADLGGQFWARKNTGFVPYTSDPTLNAKN